MTSLSIKDFDAAMAVDATSKGGVSKLVKAWEAKNTERSKRAAGLGLMAVSLAACGGSDSTDPVTPVEPPAPTPLTLELLLTDSLLTTTYLDDITVSGGASNADVLVIIAEDDTYEDNVVTLEGIENVMVRNFSGDSLELDATNWGAVQTFWINGGNEEVDIYNISEDFAGVNIRDFGWGVTADYSIYLTGEDLFSGDDDTITVTLNRAGSWDFDDAEGDYADLYVFASDYDDEDPDEDDVVEHLVVVSQTARTGVGNYLYFNNDGELRTITVTGAAGLALDASIDVEENGADTYTVDASELAGNFTLDGSVYAYVDDSIVWKGAQGDTDGGDIYVRGDDVTVNITSYGGDDSFYVDAGSYDDVTVNVSSGAGADVITIYETNNDNVISVNLGAGNDTLYLDSGATGSITLGAGVDLVEIYEYNGNIVINFDDKTVEGYLTILDFNATAGEIDRLDVSDITGTQGTFDAFDVAAAATLYDALVSVAGDLGAGQWAAFEFQGSTYIYADDGDNSLDSGDFLVELKGFSVDDLTATNFLS